jgi:hypothetical protein
MSAALDRKLAAALVAGGLLAAPLAIAFPAQAAGADDKMARIEAQLAAQDLRLADQDRRLSEQRALIEVQGAEIQELRAERDDILAIRGGQRTTPGLAAAGAPPPIQLAAQQAPSSSANLPAQPVGEAPPPPERRLEDVAAIPEGLGVLTPRGTLILEPAVEFTRSSANRLVFRGVEIVPGVQLGVIDANDADRDSVVGTFTARYGLTNRLEVEARAPYVYRHDRVTTLAQRDDSITRTTRLETNHIGDLEFAARYQLNRGLPGDAIYVANLRVKPPTGKSPYDVNYDQFGVATGLATGSGFWGVEMGGTMLYPTDPAVIFAGLSYLYNIKRNINKIIGTVPIGEVDPGDSINANVGFGLALNPRFSISLGYAHSFIFSTKSEIGGTHQKSNTLQVGSLQMGLSFRLTPRTTINGNFEFGVTSDAPDMRLVIRAPYSF